MNDNSLFAFLNPTPGTQAEPPRGLIETSFPKTGFVGPALVGIQRKVWAATRLDPEDIDTIFPGGVIGEVKELGRDGSWRYYLHDDAQAKALADFLGGMDFGRMLRVEMKVADILSLSDKGKEKFGEMLDFEVGVKTFRSKNRHEFGLIFAPSLVDALARAAGWIDKSIFDLSNVTLFPVNPETEKELTKGLKPEDVEKAMVGAGYVLDCGVWCEKRPAVNLLEEDSIAYTDQFQQDMVGLPSGPTWRHSALYHLRRKLWQALGENDPEVSNPPGYADGKGETSSPKLAQCLKALYDSWTLPLYIRIHRLPNPKVDATSGEGNRYTLPYIQEIFANKDAAQAAIDAERGEDEDKPVTHSSPNGLPAVPKDWADVPNAAQEFKDALEKFIGTNPRPVAAPKRAAWAKKACDELMCSTEDFDAWVKALEV